MPRLTVITVFDRDGAVLTEEQIEHPDPPAPDVTTLADQLASLTTAVDELILNALMGF